MKLEHSFVVFAFLFSPTCPKAKFRKKNIFIQTNSFIIFACPNPVLLVKGFGGLAQRLLLYIYKLTLIPIFCISRIK